MMQSRSFWTVLLCTAGIHWIQGTSGFGTPHSLKPFADALQPEFESFFYEDDLKLSELKLNSPVRLTPSIRLKDHFDATDDELRVHVAPQEYFQAHRTGADIELVVIKEPEKRNQNITINVVATFIAGGNKKIDTTAVLLRITNDVEPSVPQFESGVYEADVGLSKLVVGSTVPVDPPIRLKDDFAANDDQLNFEVSSTRGYFGVVRAGLVVNLVVLREIARKDQDMIVNVIARMSIGGVTKTDTTSVQLRIKNDVGPPQPQFENAAYEVDVSLSELQLGTVVPINPPIRLKDDFAATDEELRIDISSMHDYLEVQRSGPVVTLRVAKELEKRNQDITVNLIASFFDGKDSYSDTTSVLLRILNDVEPSLPQFESSAYEGAVYLSDLKLESAVKLDPPIRVKDDFGATADQLVVSSSNEYFEAKRDGTSVNLIVIKELEKKNQEIIINVVAKLTIGDVTKSDTTAVSLKITNDMQPLQPEFENTAYEVEINLSEMKLGSSIPMDPPIRLKDDFSATDDQLTFQISSLNDYFEIKRSGAVAEIVLVKELDKKNQEIIFNVIAKLSLGDTSHTDTTSVLLRILNDVEAPLPEFESSSYTGDVKLSDLKLENSVKLNTPIRLKDDYGTTDEQLTFEISPKSEYFQARREGAAVHLTIIKELEKRSQEFIFNVIAKMTAGKDIKTDTTAVSLRITNDVAPLPPNFDLPAYLGEIKPSEVSLGSSIPINPPIRLKDDFGATDSQLVIVVTPIEYFEARRSGVNIDIVLVKEIDRSLQEIRLKVEVKITIGGKTETDTTELLIRINKVDEIVPDIKFTENSYEGEFFVSELPAGSVVPLNPAVSLIDDFKATDEELRVGVTPDGYLVAERNGSAVIVRVAKELENNDQVIAVKIMAAMSYGGDVTRIATTVVRLSIRKDVEPPQPRFESSTYEGHFSEKENEPGTLLKFDPPIRLKDDFGETDRLTFESDPPGIGFQREGRTVYIILPEPKSLKANDLITDLQADIIAKITYGQNSKIDKARVRMRFWSDPPGKGDGDDENDSEHTGLLVSTIVLAVVTGILLLGMVFVYFNFTLTKKIKNGQLV